jgi:hypothetical protein
MGAIVALPSPGRPHRQGYGATSLPPRGGRVQRSQAGGVRQAGRRRQPQQQGDEVALLHRHRRLGHGEPAALALRFFRPILQQPLHLEREDLDLAGHGAAVFHALQIGVAADRLRHDLAEDARLLESLLGGQIMRREALLGPALGQYPAARLPARHQQDHGLPLALGEGQRRVLPTRTGGFAGRFPLRGRSFAGHGPFGFSDIACGASHYCAARISASRRFGPAAPIRHG